MPNRIIKQSIWTSPNFNKLSAGAERHFYRILMTTDDFGCFEATPAVIKGLCYPLQPDVSEAEIKDWYAELESAGLTKFWEHEGRRYGIFVTFQQHQRIRATHQRKTPLPPEHLLSKCEDMASDDACRQVSSSDRPIPNLIHNPNPLRDMVGQPDSLPPFKEIIDYLNEKTGKNFRFDTKDTQKHIVARWKEKYSPQDFFTVVDNQIAEWSNDPQMQKYLRPETLFGPKFQSYLNNNRGAKVSLKHDPVDRLAMEMGVTA
jgi:uncharacterized phage protein (TIGR02220 family)